MEKLSATSLSNLVVADSNWILLGRVSIGIVSVKSTVASMFRILHCHISWYWVTGQDWAAGADMHKQRFCTQGDQIVILHTSRQHFSQLRFLRHVPSTKEGGSQR